MNAVFDFVKAALPWIVIGLVLVLTIVSLGTGKKAEIRKSMLWPAGGMFLVSLMEFADHNKSSATTWLVLGCVFFILSTAEKVDKKDD